MWSQYSGLTDSSHRPPNQFQAFSGKGLMCETMNLKCSLWIWHITWPDTTLINITAHSREASYWLLLYNSAIWQPVFVLSGYTSSPLNLLLTNLQSNRDAFLPNQLSTKFSKQQTMNHITNMWPLIKFWDGLHNSNSVQLAGEHSDLWSKWMRLMFRVNS